MEFPHLGTHCAEPSCARLDFLPFTCDACQKVFCLAHKTYESHHCMESYSKDVHVPMCPLCNQPVPTNRGDDPNIKMDQHIQNDCQSEAAKKLYTNRCSFKGCKKKELVQVNCNTCHKTFCLKHRFETDHNCEGHPNRVGSVSGPRVPHPRHTRTNRAPQSTSMSHIGADLNRERLHRQRQHQQSHSQQDMAVSDEDHALAVAMAASLNDVVPSSVNPEVPTQQYDEDEALAQAIAASLQEEDSTSKQSRSQQSTCNVS